MVIREHLQQLHCRQLSELSSIRKIQSIEETSWFDLSLHRRIIEERRNRGRSRVLEVDTKLTARKHYFDGGGHGRSSKGQQQDKKDKSCRVGVRFRMDRETKFQVFPEFWYKKGSKNVFEVFRSE
jgi:hypothetical protein